MKIPCYHCNCKGRLRREDLFEPIPAILTMGIIPMIRALMENDKTDDRFWKDCPICDGKGYQQVL